MQIAFGALEREAPFLCKIIKEKSKIIIETSKIN